MILYIIGIVVGWIVGSIGCITVLTTLRFGLPLCNILLKNKEEDEEAVKLLRNKYLLSLAIWLGIIVATAILSYNFANNIFRGYIVAIIFTIILGFNSTGNNENNISDFYKSLQNQAWIKQARNENLDKNNNNKYWKIISFVLILFVVMLIAVLIITTTGLNNEIDNLYNIINQLEKEKDDLNSEYVDYKWNNMGDI